MRRKLPSDQAEIVASSNRQITRFPAGFFLSFLVNSGSVAVLVCVVGAVAESTEPFRFAIDSESRIDDKELKSVGDFRKDLQAFVKRSKDENDDTSRLGAIVDLCLLHAEIVSDPRFDKNDRLKGFRAIAADRLKKCRKQIELEMLRAERVERKNSRTGKAKYKPTGHSAASTLPAALPNPELSWKNYQSWLAEDMQAMSQISGGPVRLWSYADGNHAGPLCDYGPDLVRLIESTINPEFWRSNGGTGVIHYYRPLRILVVGGSTRIHEDLTDLLRTLRANGR